MRNHAMTVSVVQKRNLAPTSMADIQLVNKKLCESLSRGRQAVVGARLDISRFRLDFADGLSLPRLGPPMIVS